MHTKPSSPWDTQDTAGTRGPGEPQPPPSLEQGCSQHLAGGEQHLHPWICPGLVGTVPETPWEAKPALDLSGSKAQATAALECVHQGKVLRPGCGDHGSLRDLGSPSHAQPGQDPKPISHQLRKALQGLTHLPCHLLDLVPVENQAPPQELVAARQEQSTGRAEQRRTRGSFRCYLELEGSWSGRRQVLPSQFLIPENSPEPPALPWLRGLIPPGSLECLDPLLALLLRGTLEAVFPLWLLDETCQRQGKCSRQVLAEVLVLSCLPPQTLPGHN